MGSTGPESPSVSKASSTDPYERGKQIGWQKAENTVETLKSPMKTKAAMQGMIKGIGGAIIAAFMVIVVLSQVYSLDIISTGSGPFANLTGDFVTYGTAALGLVGVGIIVGAASYAMAMFGGGGMGGR
ncbi:hypothetical protein [Haloarchaeobius sp. DFWS5]|uniref:hypothetical protein n=1 Tax=Haloarchaeobius sp. DFWS5 TaxID=3446114 RepID=UPI003EBC65F2